LRLLYVKYNRREKYLDLKLVSKIDLRQNSYLRCFDGPTVTHVICCFIRKGRLIFTALSLACLLYEICIQLLVLSY